jgi:hypothetical protein
MAMSSQDLGPSPYYYASGRRVELTRENEVVAVEASRLADVKKGTAHRSIPKDALSLGSGLVMVSRESLTSRQIEGLEKDGAAQPVFRAQGTRIVVLPEVRVEDPSPKVRLKLRDWVEKDGAAEVIGENGDCITLRPSSGRGLDALDLANRITEEVGPTMAQARFIRIIDRPGVRR